MSAATAYARDQFARQTNWSAPTSGLKVSSIECNDDGVFELTFQDGPFPSPHAVVATHVWNDAANGKANGITEDLSYASAKSTYNANVNIVFNSAGAYKYRIVTGGQTTPSPGERRLRQQQVGRLKRQRVLPELLPGGDRVASETSHGIQEDI